MDGERKRSDLELKKQILSLTLITLNAQEQTSQRSMQCTHISAINIVFCKSLLSKST